MAQIETGQNVVVFSPEHMGQVSEGLHDVFTAARRGNIPTDVDVSRRYDDVAGTAQLVVASTRFGVNFSAELSPDGVSAQLFRWRPAKSGDNSIGVVLSDELEQGPSGVVFHTVARYGEAGERLITAVLAGSHNTVTQLARRAFFLIGVQTN